MTYLFFFFFLKEYLFYKLTNISSLNPIFLKKFKSKLITILVYTHQITIQDHLFIIAFKNTYHIPLKKYLPQAYSYCR